MCESDLINEIVNNSTDDHIDDHVDEEIQACLSNEYPKSFFMFAGAGSGKTRSLIKALEYLSKEKGDYMTMYAKQVAVITYTNAACDEINRRLKYQPLFLVSTIHSFLWELIKSFQLDIRNWIIMSIQADIEDLVNKQKSGRGGNAATKREVEIIKKRKRLEKINTIKRFTYNPNGENIGFDSLSHNEVVKIGAEFIATNETMQNILVTKYPIMLIDECQDTKKELVDALLCVYENHKKHWMIGMFGDTMQKIYTDGKDNLENVIPCEWVFPSKVMNHRSAKRIVSLANAIRKDVDNKVQYSRSDAIEGTVRLFISDSFDKEVIENNVTNIMSKTTGDLLWSDENEYKSLILEHHMAASRFKFNGIYKPLDESGVFDTSLRDGSISELSFLANVIIPLVKAYNEANNFEVAKIIRQYSTLLKRETFPSLPSMQIERLNQVDSATDSLLALWKEHSIPTCLEILNNIKKSGLFELSERVDDILDVNYAGDDIKVISLRKALSVSIDELERYDSYVKNYTRYATHQGIKGLEFPRVLVVLDDGEAKGFLFSYEKIFGAKAKSDSDIKNEREGKDTSLCRTARLFYVACTRAQESLAVIIYTSNPEMVKNTAIEKGWFTEDEIICM